MLSISKQPSGGSDITTSGRARFLGAIARNRPGINTSLRATHPFTHRLLYSVMLLLRLRHRDRRVLVAFWVIEKTQVFIGNNRDFEHGEG